MEKKKFVAFSTNEYIENIFNKNKVEKGQKAAFIKVCISHFDECKQSKQSKPNLPQPYGANAEWEKRRKLEKLTTKK